MTVIDGTDLVLGRLASNVAKRLMNGEQVELINAESIRRIGSQADIVQHYRQKRALQNKGTPEKSPHHSRVPHLFVKRVIRGMVPWKEARGKKAMKFLRVYAGNPKNLTGAITFKEFVTDETQKSISVKEICRLLGYNK
jgi:large subunit ribosomal protein L13